MYILSNILSDNLTFYSAEEDQQHLLVEISDNPSLSLIRPSFGPGHFHTFLPVSLQCFEGLQFPFQSVSVVIIGNSVLRKYQYISTEGTHNCYLFVTVCVFAEPR